ncbi:MAG: T9SS type A sorting domain-containing protein [bacterium]
MLHRILVALLFLAFFFVEEQVFAQTHYTGTAFVIHILADCTGVHSDSSNRNLTYGVIPRPGHSDSVGFSLGYSMLYNSGVFVKQRVYPFDPFGGLAMNDTIIYLKNDADSIVFSYTIAYSFTEHNSFVALTDPCRNYTDEERFRGIGRISNTTADVDQEQSPASIRLFPNPATDKIQISGSMKTLVVVDATGRTVMPNIQPSLYSDAAFTLDVSTLASGCYSVIISEGQHIRTGKFIKY